jgi:hypothetical protein
VQDVIQAEQIVFLDAVQLLDEKKPEAHTVQTWH